jgi:tripartite-type tricarboxylate transporter receptor subunit TctC
MHLQRHLKIATLLVLAAAGSAHAQTFPTKPIRFIVGFPPGGAVDLVARAVAPGIGDVLGVQVIVDNRPGANGMIGAELVAKAAPDGHVIGLVSISSMVLNVLMQSNPPYQAKDFTPLSTVGLVPFGLGVHPSVPARSLKELIALARSRPARLTVGSPGVGSLQHLTIEMLNATAKVKLGHVPYKGTGPALTDVLGGHIDGLVTAISGVIVPARSGKLRLLAVMDAQRSQALPEVPTAHEQGLANFNVVNWYAIAAPPNLPAPIANALHAAIAKTTATPIARERLVAGGVDPKTDASPAAFAQYVRDEFARWSKVVKDSGIKLE